MYFGSKANQIITLDNSDLACTVLFCLENVSTVVALNRYWIIVDRNQFEGQFFVYRIDRISLCIVGCVARAVDKGVRAVRSNRAP
jgi:hypothetical protein